jgi:hypothetical protein
MKRPAAGQPKKNKKRMDAEDDFEYEPDSEDEGEDLQTKIKFPHQMCVPSPPILGFLSTQHLSLQPLHDPIPEERVG